MKLHIKVLDDFLDFYEWSIIKNNDNIYKYIIYDLQTREEVEVNYTLEQVLDRVVGRAIDYYTNEWVENFEYFDLDITNETIKWFEELLEIGEDYLREDNYKGRCLNNFKSLIYDLKKEVENK